MQFQKLYRLADLRFLSITIKNLVLLNIQNTKKRLKIQRLTDLRFLSIDFLNTFLLTYRVFAEGVQVDFKLSLSLSLSLSLYFKDTTIKASHFKYLSIFPISNI